ncbi:MAG TPA: tetratricopeptide repeat protein [Anaerolineales bacterium]|nr:tetratricopeptide repeat protein [Anaerolineales bacterium]
MSELAADFQYLSREYQALIQLAQDQYRLTITPLDKLVGGWSGAIVYLVSVSANASKQVEHYILKLDHKGKSSKADEVTRHNSALSKSPLAFARDHIARLALQPLEHEGAIAIFYDIAGQSLRDYRPLSNYRRQSQLKTIFTTTNTLLLTKWNANIAFEQAIHPQQLLSKWLGFRLDPGGSSERFLQEVCQIHPDVAGLLINGSVFHNPFAFARKKEYWWNVRPVDSLVGLLHGDLNTNNILVKFSTDDETLEGYYLIDFALFKDHMPLLYDQRYLEMSYLVLSMSRVSIEKSIELIVRLGEVDILEPHQAPVEMAGVCSVIGSGREAFNAWVREYHPSLYDDLWGQYWLAGVAAGLSYCHKPGAPEEQRLAGLVYAAANLKRFSALFPLPTPREVSPLYDEDRFRGAPQSQGAGTPAPEVLHNLPVQLTTFIGRQEEIATTREMLLRKDVQLVTLTGPGGTGKTRLSLEVAASLLDRFRDGVYFVPLADVGDPEQVVARIAQQLEVRSAGSQPLFKNLKDYLRDRNILLLLDNLEQLVSATPVVGELLAVAPALKVLATSRILLSLRGEHELPILPLHTPDLTDSPSVESLAENESVKLFTERARAAQPHFTLTRDNALAVAQICQRLDGLPLAIELAAARIKMLPPQAILTRLSDRLKLLTGGARDLPIRQQTLRSTLDWSYGLLNPQEKALYARLAVFVGGFSLEAAETVCNVENQLDILEGITSLVNNSLLKQEETTEGEPRFRMLETIRAYALERLTESGEMPELRRAHAHYYAGMIINEAGDGLLGPESTFWLDKLEAEHDNIQAVLDWTQTTSEGRQLALPLLATLTWFWYRRGFFSEGRMWTEQILASADTEPGPERAAAIQMSSRMALWRGDLHIAVMRAKESLILWQRLEDEHSVPMSLMETAVVLINMGNDSEAHTLLKEAEFLFRESGKSYFRAITLVHLGNVSLGLGNPDEARDWLEQAYPLFQEIGEKWGLSFVLNNLGEVARVRGDYGQARRYYEESEALLRATGDKGDLARLVHSLGYIALHKEDYARAESQFTESLAMFRKLGNKRGIAECIAGLASLRAKHGKPHLAAQMLGAAEALLGASGAAWWPADRVEVEKTQGIIQSSLSEDEFAAARTAGQAMGLEQAIALVLDEA